MPELPITYRGTIYPWHCDHMGHMNVMWYVGKFDEATWQFLSKLVFHARAYRRKERAWRLSSSISNINASCGLATSSQFGRAVLEVKEKAVRFAHEMWNDESGELAARTVLVGVNFDLTARKARNLPADVRERAAAMMEEHSIIRT